MQLPHSQHARISILVTEVLLKRRKQIGQGQTGLNPAFLYSSVIYRMSSAVNFVVSLFFFLQLFRDVLEVGLWVECGTSFCESTQPIFYLLINIIVSVIRMDSTKLIDLIEQLSSVPEKQVESRCLQIIQSLSQAPNCNRCQILQQGNIQLRNIVAKSSSEYNSLLRTVKILINLYYEVFETQQAKFEQAAAQIEQDNQDCYDKIKQMEEIIQENNKVLSQYRNLLLQKDEHIMRIEDMLQANNNKQTKLLSPTHQIQKLKYHGRQKSQLCTRLQYVNANLINENKKVREENSQLTKHIIDLKQYISRMEDDLASNNIKSPRIIAQFCDNAERNKPNETHNNIVQEQYHIEQSSLDEQNSIAEAENIKTHKSTKSSFLMHRKPLRQILDFSGQTSNYFHFRTKQKLEESSSKNLSNQNFNSYNVILQSKSSQKNVLQIKQFEVAEVIDKQQRVSIDARVKNNPKNNKPQLTQKQVPFDPYYSFFILTIQCLKLNWHNLNEVANINISDQWSAVLQKQVPINKWSQYLHRIMQQKVKQQRSS